MTQQTLRPQEARRSRSASSADRLPQTVAPAKSAEANRFVPAMLLLFVGSGCAALIYEIVWLQMLQLVIGSTAVSIGILLGTFMGGMCLGSLLFARVVSPAPHPLRVYALLELGIGVIGVVLLYLLPYLGPLYTATLSSGISDTLLRGVYCALCLLPPTVLMGATLPAIARWMETTPQGLSLLGFFYGANIAGAVFGCLLAGFYLLRVHDIAFATYTAVAINVAVAACGWFLSILAPYQPTVSREAAEASDADEARVPWSIYVVIALSGMSALGAEVIWARLLSLLLGATVYTFSLILAVFLIGLGIGSSVGSLLARGPRPRLALGVCQLLLTATVAWAAYSVTESLPYWPIDVSLARTPWLNFQLDMMRCIWAMLPAACLWGASFPLALAAAATRGQDPGRLVGGVYAANTVGAIAGSVLFSMVVIGEFGTQQGQQALIAMAFLSALIALVPLVWKSLMSAATSESHTAGPQPSFAGGLLGGAALLASCWVAFFLVGRVPAVPDGLIGYGRYLSTYWEDLPEFLESTEGMNASIAVSEESDGMKNFHVSGKVVASSGALDMRLQRMLCHLPSLMHTEPKSVLIVGCGAGVTAGTFVVHPSIEEIVICEIEPSIPPLAAKHFGDENYDVMEDERTEVVYDDARHYIVTTDKKFDIITSDPIHPWVKGAAALYSEEYFRLCKEHLNPGGIVTQWVPLYESTEEAVKSQIATFFKVFPDGTIWSNDDNGSGYDIVLLGRAEPTPIDVGELDKRLKRADHAEVLASLREIHQDSVVDLLSTYSGRHEDMADWLEGYQLNSDRNLRLQYLAGMGLNLQEGEGIHRAMMAKREYPEDHFINAGELEQKLRNALQ